MKRIQLTPTLLVLLLISSLITNISVWKLGGSLQILATQEIEVTSVTLKITCPDGTNAGTITVDQEQGETFAAFIVRAKAERDAAAEEFCYPATG